MINKHRNSIFDEYRLKELPWHISDWIRVPSYFTLDPCCYLVEGELLEHIQSENLFLHYILTADFLLRVDTSSNPDFDISGLKRPYNISYVNLLLPQAAKLKRDGRYGFSLQLGSNLKEFTCDSKGQFKKWFKALKEVAVMKDIESEYSIKEAISKGSTALVKIGVARKEEKHECAIKNISKKIILGKYSNLVYTELKRVETFS